MDTSSVCVSVRDLAVYEGDSISMSCQHSYWLRRVFPKCASVPHFTQCIIAAREQQLRRNFGERHGVHVVLMGVNLKHTRTHTINNMHARERYVCVSSGIFAVCVHARALTFKVRLFSSRSNTYRQPSFALLQRNTSKSHNTHSSDFKFIYLFICNKTCFWENSSVKF